MADQIKLFMNRYGGRGLKYRLVPTKNAPDAGEKTRQRVDASLFHKDDYDLDEWAPKNTSRSPRWDLHRLHVEFKSGIEKDAFDDLGKVFERATDDGHETRAQITSYAALTFKYQHRGCLFTVLVLGPYARIIRWDRAGAIVTTRFNYKQDSGILSSFFWRFTRSNKAGQGIDITATVASADDRQLMREESSDKLPLDFRDYSREYFSESLTQDRDWWRLSVPSDDGYEKTYLVGSSHFDAGWLNGRGTRGYVALDLDYVRQHRGSNSWRKFVWLKDAWRVNQNDIQQEGSILRHLNEHKVKHIPHVLCHGDVANQQTITHMHWVGADTQENPLRIHTHYRVVVQDVGRPLKTFVNGVELAMLIYDCVTGKLYLKPILVLTQC